MLRASVLFAVGVFAVVQAVLVPSERENPLTFLLLGFGALGGYGVYFAVRELGPAPVRLRADLSGLTFEYDSGRTATWSWSSPGLRFELREVDTVLESTGSFSGRPNYQLKAPWGSSVEILPDLFEDLLRLASEQKLATRRMVESTRFRRVVTSRYGPRRNPGAAGFSPTLANR